MQRYDIINTLIRRYDFKKYLEIGVCGGDCIRNIECDNKDGIDSGHEGWVVPETNYHMTSDEFFSLNEKIYDIVFIDGLHHADQVDRDIENALKCTTEFAAIVLHDCNPPAFEYSIVPRQHETWNGDVYKSVLKLQRDNKNHTFFTVDTDWGVGVILKNIPSFNTLSELHYDSGINDWDIFDKHRKLLLNLISVETFKTKFGNLS